MIYIFINIALCATLIWTSFTIDVRNSIKNNNPLVNMVLFLATLFGLNTFCLIAGFWAPVQLARVLGKFWLMLFGWYAIYTCFYEIEVPSYKRSRASYIFQWLFNFMAVYLIFIQPRGIVDITFSQKGGMKVWSEPVFSGKLREFIPMDCFGFYCTFFFGILPLFSTIMLLVRAENVNSKLDRQRMHIVAFGVVAFWLTYGLLRVAAQYQPMISYIEMVSFIAELLLFIKAASVDSLWDGVSILRAAARFLLKFAVPAALVGLLFAALWPDFSNYPVLCIVLFIAIVAAIITILYEGGKAFNKRNLLRDSDYAKLFENELADIDYSGDPKEITEKLFTIFKTNVHTSALQILIDGGVGDLETVYSSNNSNYKVPLSNNCFDVLLNQNHPVVFREYASHNYTVAGIRQDLLALLDQTNSDAFIMLNEGRHIIGVMFLGKKTTENVYNEYDYTVFTKLYSYFFVIGYYMKNIVNESVVGTVNREIKMSGQIITSIQENMDYIKSPKVDAGYIMVPAHNIGGEFIDLIRLTDTRHIFVIGAMSGKGIAASMSMVILKSVIRTFLAETKDFKLLVEKVNTFIRTGLPKGTFFAGTFGLLDFSTDTMYYINCGSPALFLYTRAYNNVIEIQGEGRVLGFVKDIDHLIKVKKVKLAEGDIVFSCTPGLIETHSLRGEIFGKDRVQKALMENFTYPADKMARFTYDSLVQFTSKELEDDVSILVLKYLGGK